MSTLRPKPVRSKNNERAFKMAVRRYYRRYGRHDLPWRQTTDPYRIFVSEVMLQQTQVPRVIPKYEEFLNSWPSVQALAAASLGNVLRQWQGLGYNRRAKLLHQAARYIQETHGGRFPRRRAELLAIPGVGPYTAGAILAFAFNQPAVMIETNIRTVFLHHFFEDADGVPDALIYPLIERTVDVKDPRHWYAALMDYGSHLKATIGNQNRRSRHYAKQTPFAGSDRQLRGAIMRELGQRNADQAALHRRLPGFGADRVVAQLAALVREGLVERSGRRYRLPA